MGGQERSELEPNRLVGRQPLAERLGAWWKFAGVLAGKERLITAVLPAMTLVTMLLNAATHVLSQFPEIEIPLAFRFLLLFVIGNGRL